MITDAQVRAFLTESLALWGASGRVVAGEHPALAVIRVDSGTIVWVERPSGDYAPFRWAVRWRNAGEGPGGAREVRPRTCGSLAGVLSAVRSALGVDRGSPVRVVPAPEGA